MDRSRSPSWPTPDALNGTPCPRRSAPRLLTSAPRGGLRPPPAGRPRRTTSPEEPAPPSPMQHRISRSIFYIRSPSAFRVHTRPDHLHREPTRRLDMTSFAPRRASGRCRSWVPLCARKPRLSRTIASAFPPARSGRALRRRCDRRDRARSALPGAAGIAQEESSPSARAGGCFPTIAITGPESTPWPPLVHLGHDVRLGAGWRETAGLPLTQPSRARGGRCRTRRKAAMSSVLIAWSVWGRRGTAG
jgi:hypothetical protein